MFQPRSKHLFLLSVAVAFVVFLTFLRDGIRIVSTPIVENVHDKIAPPGPKGPKYKDTPSVKYPDVEENFPLAAAAHSKAELPSIPLWNAPPSPHIKEVTPLFIGFTRNWRLLQQVVVSYITAGWPPEDIYVVENTGVMDSNKRGLLSLQNPFFLNHTRLEMLGVNILTTPTLLTFAQLQNFYIYTSIGHEWPHYFWSHMDIIVASFEDRDTPPPNEDTPPEAAKPEPHKFQSLYNNCVLALRKTFDLPADKPWASRFFSYDRLALVNVKAYTGVGGWDTMIPFYTTDCDMHFRLEDSGYTILEENVGMVWDVAASLDDLIVLYRKKTGDGPKDHQVPLPGFKDPNIIDQELSAIVQSEKAVKEAKLEDALSPTLKPSTQQAPRSPVPVTSQWTGENGYHNWTDDNPYPSPSPLFLHLLHTFDAMSNSKGASAKGRNTWQSRATGGEGEPFYRDSRGFEEAIYMTILHGRNVFGQKWGHRDCDLKEQGLHVEDVWKVERDWD